MKKLIAIASILAITAGAALAIEWTEHTNLAAGATVTVSSNPGAANTITDNNEGSSWQAQGGANKLCPDWVLLDLGEVQTFTDIEIMWEASHMTKYDIYVSTDEIPYAAENFAEDGEPEKNFNVIDAGWLATAVPVLTDQGQEGETSCTDNLIINNGATGRYVLLYGKEYNGWASNYGSRIFQIRIANIPNAERNQIETLAITADPETIQEGESTTVRVEALTVTGESASIEDVDNLTLISDNEERIEITGGENGVYTVKALMWGTYTLTATGLTNDKELTGSLTLKVTNNWDIKDNVAEGKAILARISSVSETDNATPLNATDGNEDSYYEYNGNWGGGDSWVIVDLGKEYAIEGVGVSYGDHSGGKYKLAFGGEDAELPSDDLDKVWNTYGLQGWTETDQMDRVSNEKCPYNPVEIFKTRYIAVIDVDNPEGKPQVKEIYVAGEEIKVSQVAELILSASQQAVVTGENVEFSVSALDQYGLPIDTPAEITYIVNDEVIEGNSYKPLDKGVCEVRAYYREIGSNSVLLNVVADSQDLASEEQFGEYTVTFGDESKTYNAQEGNASGLIGGTGNVGLYEWSQDDIDNGKALEIAFRFQSPMDMIELRWEASCPKSYRVILEDAAGNRTEIPMISDRGVDGNVNDRIYRMSDVESTAHRAPILTGSSLGNVQKITVIPTESNNNNGWTNKLLGVNLYGQPLDYIVTGIEGAEIEKNAYNDVWYSLQGIRVSAPDAPGVYIHNGKKVIIRE